MGEDDNESGNENRLFDKKMSFDVNIIPYTAEAYAQKYAFLSFLRIRTSACTILFATLRKHLCCINQHIGVELLLVIECLYNKDLN